MTSDELRKLCYEAVEKIHAIPFSDWPESELLACVLCDVFSVSIDTLTAENETLRQRVAELEQDAKRYRRMRAAGVADRFAPTEDEFDKKCDEALSERSLPDAALEGP